MLSRCAARDARREGMLVGGTNKTHLVTKEIQPVEVTRDPIEGVRPHELEFCLLWPRIVLSAIALTQQICVCTVAVATSPRQSVQVGQADPISGI